MTATLTIQGRYLVADLSDGRQINLVARNGCHGRMAARLARIGVRVTSLDSWLPRVAEIYRQS